MFRRRLTAPALPFALAAAATVAGCSWTENFLGGDRVDYRTQARTTEPLEVPPDLTQLARDSRYRPQGGGVVSASAAAAAASAPGTSAAQAASVAPSTVGQVRVVREGQQRWLVTSLPPEALWPQLRAFWLERGFTLDIDSPDAGVMETGWAENRAKIQQDWLRSTIGKVFEGAWDSGFRDRFRTRVERGPVGTEIYITHRGMEEVLVAPALRNVDERTMWRPRPSDPELEAEFLARLMIKLGTTEAVARAAVAPPAAAAAAAPVAATAAATSTATSAASTSATATSLELGESFDRAWRRVGIALDRIGFTVEDRDRAAGLYFVRYVDPATLPGEDQGFWSKLFSRDSKSTGPTRIRVLVKGDTQRATISVQNQQGAPDTGEIAKRIIAALAAELK